jgi:hypothetical protein
MEKGRWGGRRGRNTTPPTPFSSDTNPFVELFVKDDVAVKV